MPFYTLKQDPRPSDAVVVFLTSSAVILYDNFPSRTQLRCGYFFTHLYFGVNLKLSQFARAPDPTTFTRDVAFFSVPKNFTQVYSVHVSTAP